MIILIRKGKCMDQTIKNGRSSQGKFTRPYSIDRELTTFIDALPSGERSRFVNHLLFQGVEIEKLSGRYYTYLLMRPDGSVFYVGKGQDNRIDQHELEAKKGIQSEKCDVIRAIWEQGGEIIKQKVGFFDKEEDAHALEMALIDFFGNEKLTNKTKGTGDPNSLTMRLTGTDRETIERLKLVYKSSTDSDAVRALLQLVAFIPTDLMASVQMLAQQDTRTINQEIIVLLGEAVAARKNHQDWLSYAKPVE